MAFFTCTLKAEQPKEPPHLNTIPAIGRYEVQVAVSAVYLYCCLLFSGLGRLRQAYPVVERSAQYLGPAAQFLLYRTDRDTTYFWP